MTILIKNFEKIDSSLEKFMRIFFRKFYEQKVFKKFIICYLLRVINETYFKDWTNLLNYLTTSFQSNSRRFEIIYEDLGRIYSRTR